MKAFVIIELDVDDDADRRIRDLPDHIHFSLVASDWLDVGVIPVGATLAATEWRNETGDATGPVL